MREHVYWDSFGWQKWFTNKLFINWTTQPEIKTPMNTNQNTDQPQQYDTYIFN